MAVILGAAWRALSPDERAPFEELARHDRARYEKALAAVAAAAKVAPEQPQPDDEDEEPDKEEEEEVAAALMASAAAHEQHEGAASPWPKARR